MRSFAPAPSPGAPPRSQASLLPSKGQQLLRAVPPPQTSPVSLQEATNLGTNVGAGRAQTSLPLLPARPWSGFGSCVLPVPPQPPRWVFNPRDVPAPPRERDLVSEEGRSFHERPALVQAPQQRSIPLGFSVIFVLTS